MPKPYPKEFREDVARVARKRESTLEQVAHDFGISESGLAKWINQAVVEDGIKPGITVTEAAMVALGIGVSGGEILEAIEFALPEADVVSFQHVVDI